MVRALMHPRMWMATREWWQHRCTLYASTTTQDADGQERHTWAVVTNMVDIPCVFGVMPGMANDAERRRFQQTFEVKEHTALLRGLFPEIDTTYRAGVDGVLYNIVGADVDTQMNFTRLRLERIR